jgi:outer membrane protein OmpA-like peptidoglycan-associated protein
MNKSLSLFFLLASISQSALANGPVLDPAFDTPTSTIVAVSFPDSGTVFRPTAEQVELLADVQNASMITINGRTSTNTPSMKDETLALARAVSARSWLVRHGVSPLKIMINYVSAADFIADNSTPEGRYENQRVEIETIYVPTY